MPKFFCFIIILLNSTDNAFFGSIYGNNYGTYGYMKKRIILAAAAVLLALGGWQAGGILFRGMKAAEVVRKLSAIRLALALYAVEHKEPPAAFEGLLDSGKLEAVPELKLRGHFYSSKVANVPAFAIRDTGGWAYVNDPRSRDFGLAYIDCSHKDEKGRYWSEF